jgi:hypothetical protein
MRPLKSTAVAGGKKIAALYSPVHTTGKMTCDRVAPGFPLYGTACALYHQVFPPTPDLQMSST